MQQLLQTAKPDWLSSAECPEAVVDFLPSWKKAVVLKLEKFRRNCHDCRQMSWSRGIEFNMSFTENFQWAVSQAYLIKHYMENRDGIKITLSEDYARSVTLKYENGYGATSTLKIILR